MGISREGGFQKHNNLKESMTLNRNFQRSGGVSNPSVGGIDIFYNNKILHTVACW